jgi:hypothetical protein
MARWRKAIDGRVVEVLRDSMCMSECMIMIPFSVWLSIAKEVEGIF